MESKRKNVLVQYNLAKIVLDQFFSRYVGVPDTIFFGFKKYLFARVPDFLDVLQQELYACYSVLVRRIL